MPQSPYLDDQSTVPYVLPQTPARRTPAVQRDDALKQAPGRPVLMLHPALVKIRDTTGFAIAYTVTHVLVELDGTGPYTLKWEASWLVNRL